MIVRPDRTIASLGFNGLPMPLPDAPEILGDREEKYEAIIHAEMNALLFAREPIDGYTLYSTLFPCSRCAAHIIQKGVARVVSFASTPEQYARWGKSAERAEKMFAGAQIPVEYYSNYGEQA